MNHLAALDSKKHPALFKKQPLHFHPVMYGDTLKKIDSNKRHFAEASPKSSFEAADGQTSFA
ncbi:UNVERIFIED_CONTAM: hypothetical protein FO487_21415 [Bacillus amyloliquefaciens DSM 7 = ATCC 23350]